MQKEENGRSNGKKAGAEESRRK
jgi:hypothetical protein